MSSSSLTNASPSPDSPAPVSNRAASYLNREVASDLVDGCKRVLGHPREALIVYPCYQSSVSMPPEKIMQRIPVNVIFAVSLLSCPSRRVLYTLTQSLTCK